MASADKEHVLQQLEDKIDALLRAEEEFDRRLEEEADQEKRQRIEFQKGEAVDERVLCEARRSAIDADGGFADPGPEAEDSLLRAIRRVDRAIQNTAALSAFFAATRALVAAYAAESTNA